MVVISILEGIENMSAFIVSRVVVHDKELFKRYQKEALPILRSFGGLPLAVNKPVILEGDKKWTLSTVISFPSEEKAKAFYDSEVYQEVAKKRRASTTTDAHMIKGF